VLEKLYVVESQCKCFSHSITRTKELELNLLVLHGNNQDREKYIGHLSNSHNEVQL